MNSSEELFAQPNEGDNKKPRCYIFGFTSWVSMRFQSTDGATVLFHIFLTLAQLAWSQVINFLAAVQ
jgi:hypothetical protein